jgi:hypothetical protein
MDKIIIGYGKPTINQICRLSIPFLSIERTVFVLSASLNMLEQEDFKINQIIIKNLTITNILHKNLLFIYNPN